MFDVKDSEPFDTDEDDFDTVLERDITFTGNIRFSKPFMIKGKMSGLIEATSDLLIDTDAEVDADITAARVLVRGKVKGNIKGYKMVYVTSTGSVNGEIASARPVLELGSTVNGKIAMLQGSKASGAEKPDLFASGGF